jgi:hypothetical protein
VSKLDRLSTRAYGRLTLRRVRDLENRPRNRAARAEESGLTGSGKVIARPGGLTPLRGREMAG